jgi:xanthosine utilization system XapX-like protein
VSEQSVQRPTPEDWARSIGRTNAMFPTRRPGVVVRADLLPAISVASTAALVGLPLAWVWSRIAPAIPGVLNASGQPVPLPSPYGYHRFDDLAIFMLLGLGAGLATGIAIWMLRERRGPTVMLAGVLGALIGAWLAMHTGESFAAAHYALSSAPKAGTVFDIAPRLETSWGIIAQPLGTALAYGVLAAWNSTNDLGRRLS